MTIKIVIIVKEEEEEVASVNRRKRSNNIIHITEAFIHRDQRCMFSRSCTVQICYSSQRSILFIYAAKYLVQCALSMFSVVYSLCFTIYFQLNARCLLCSSIVIRVYIFFSIQTRAFDIKLVRFFRVACNRCEILW